MANRGQQRNFNGICVQLAPPRQSAIVCSICCCIGIITMILVSSITLSVTQNTGYAATTQIPIPNELFSNPFKEWQFTKYYIQPNKRLIKPIFHLIISTLFVIIIYIIIWLLIFFINPLSNAHKWLLDDLISFTKGYILSIFVCHTIFLLLSSYISLPIPSYYELCDFNTHKNECSITNETILQEAHSSFPNATMGLLISSLGYLSFWLTGKFMQCLLYPQMKKLCESNSINNNDLYGYFNSYLLTSLQGMLVITIPFIPLYFGIFLCSTLVYDNMASASDFNGTVIAS
eukprot:271636_1